MGGRSPTSARHESSLSSLSLSVNTVNTFPYVGRPDIMTPTPWRCVSSRRRTTRSPRQERGGRTAPTQGWRLHGQCVSLVSRGMGRFPLSLWTGRKEERTTARHNTTVACTKASTAGRNSGPGRCFLFPPALGRGPNNWPTQAPTTLSAALCSELPFCLLLGERWALPVQMVICPHHRDATMSVVAPCDNGGAESPLLGLLLLPPLLRGDGMTNPP